MKPLNLQSLSLEIFPTKGTFYYTTREDPVFGLSTSPESRLKIVLSLFHYKVPSDCGTRTQQCIGGTTSLQVTVYPDLKFSIFLPLLILKSEEFPSLYESVVIRPSVVFSLPTAVTHPPTDDSANFTTIDKTRNVYVVNHSSLVREFQVPTPTTHLDPPPPLLPLFH